MAELIATALMDVEFFALMADECITANTEEEDRAINSINFVTMMFESFCNRHLAARDYSFDPISDDYDQGYSVFDAPDECTFWFPTYPVNSITEFFINTTQIYPATSYNSTNGYHLYSRTGKLLHYGGFYYGYPQNVKVKWNGGYAVGSNERIELQHMCFQTVKDIYTKLDDVNTGLKSQTIGTYSYQNFSPLEMNKYRSLHPIVFHTLAKKYKREVFA